MGCILEAFLLLFVWLCFYLWTDLTVQLPSSTRVYPPDVSQSEWLVMWKMHLLKAQWQQFSPLSTKDISKCQRFSRANDKDMKKTIIACKSDFSLWLSCHSSSVPLFISSKIIWCEFYESKTGQEVFLYSHYIFRWVNSWHAVISVLFLHAWVNGSSLVELLFIYCFSQGYLKSSRLF